MDSIFAECYESLYLDIFRTWNYNRTIKIKN